MFNEYLKVGMKSPELGPINIYDTVSGAVEETLYLGSAEITEIWPDKSLVKVFTSKKRGKKCFELWLKNTDCGHLFI